MKPCKKCGSTERYKNGRCAPCQREHSRRYQQANSKKAKEVSKKWYWANREKQREWRRQYYLANREKQLKQNRQWHETNRERTMENSRKYRQANPEKVKRASKRWYKANRKRVKEISKQWYEANRERIRKVSRQWYKTNHERVKKNTKRYQQAHPERYRSYEARRRAHKARVHAESYDFEAICAYYSNKCLCCGRDDLLLTADHILPISKGGPDIAENIQPLCGSCNSSKGTQAIDYRPKQEFEIMGIQYSIPLTLSI